MKDRDNLQDIIRVFLECGKDCGVTFVAADLSLFPPLSVTNYDVMSVVQDVESLKSSLKLILANQQVMSDLLSEQLQQTSRVTEEVRQACSMKTQTSLDLSICILPCSYLRVYEFRIS